MPGAVRNVTFSVSGMTKPLTDVRITGLRFDPPHGFVGDLTVSLIAPNGATHVIFSRTGATTATGTGDTSDALGPYTFADDATGSWWAAAAAVDINTAVAPGSYRTSQSGGAGSPSPAPATNLTAAFAGVPDPNGTWTLRFLDNCGGDDTSVTAATLELTDSRGCSAQQSAVLAATATATSADQAIDSAKSAVAKAQKKVKKAKKGLKEALLSGTDRAIGKARAKLKKAKKANKAGKAQLAAAQQLAATAHQQLASAQAASTACQQA